MIVITDSYVTFLEMTHRKFLCRSRLGANHQKLFPVPDQKIYKLIKLAEWWICDDNIVITVINILVSDTLSCLWVVATYADGLNTPFFCLIEQVINELAFHQVHPLFYLLACFCNVNVLDCPFWAKQPPSQHVTFFLIDNLFIVAFVPVTGAEDTFASQLRQIVTYLVGNVLEQCVVLVVFLFLAALQS